MTRSPCHHSRGMKKDSIGELTPRPSVDAGGLTERIGDWIPMTSLMCTIA